MSYTNDFKQGSSALERLSMNSLWRKSASITEASLTRDVSRLNCYAFRTSGGQRRRSVFKSGGVPSPPSLSLPSSFPPSLPLPSPSLPLPPLLGVPSHPLIRLGGLGERSSSPSGSGRSPAVRRFLVHFRLKRTLLVNVITIMEEVPGIASVAFASPSDRVFN